MTNRFLLIFNILTFLVVSIIFWFIVSFSLLTEEQINETAEKAPLYYWGGRLVGLFLILAILTSLNYLMNKIVIYLLKCKDVKMKAIYIRQILGWIILIIIYHLFKLIPCFAYSC
jgi:hypothetical protein